MAAERRQPPSRAGNDGPRSPKATLRRFGGPARKAAAPCIAAAVSGWATAEPRAVPGSGRGAAYRPDVQPAEILPAAPRSSTARLPATASGLSVSPMRTPGVVPLLATTWPRALATTAASK